MFRSTAYRQLNKAAAILALALLCAQTMVVVHDHHHTSEAELCAVCATSVEKADAPAAAAADLTFFRAVSTVVDSAPAPETAPTRFNSARAPPTV